MLPPDAAAVVEQLLRSHLHTRRVHGLRRMWIGLGGYAQLRSAGLSVKQARAVNTKLKRTARHWCKTGAPPDKAIAAEVGRLLHGR